jgi:hypothetical protein
MSESGIQKWVGQLVIVIMLVCMMYSCEIMRAFISFTR